MTPQWANNHGGSTDVTYQKVEVFTDAGCTAFSMSKLAAWSDTSASISLPGDGTYYFKVRSYDFAENPGVSPCSGGLTVDTMAPTGATIDLDSGAAYASTSSVTVNLTGTGATHMYVTNTAGCGSGGSWEAYSTTKPGWALGTSNGVATVYMKLKDGAGNETGCMNDTITHDDTAPTGTSGLITPADSAGGGDTSFDDDTSIYFAWSAASDGGSGIKDYTLMRYDLSGCAGGSTNTAGITVTNHNFTGAVDGTTYSFKVEAFDNAGNSYMSGCSTDITVDMTAPTDPSGISVALNASDVDFTFTLSSDGYMSHYEFKLCTNSDCATGCLTAQAGGGSPYTFTAPATGTYYGCMRAVDQAGNISPGSYLPSGGTVNVP